MGKVLLAAIVAAVVSALVTAAVLASLQKGDRATSEVRIEEAEKKVEDQRDALDVALRRIDGLQRRLDASVDSPRAGRAAAPSAPAADGSAGGAAAPPGALAPDGTPWVSRAELEKALLESRPAPATAAAFPPPPEKKSVEDIAREMGLSAMEEATVRQILREGEEEAVRCLFGDRPLADIVADVKAAKSDPDRMEALVQQTVTHAFANLGKLATLENRSNKRVEEALGKERAKEFLAKPRKPVLDVDVEELLGDAFDD